jgi:hypothetical protein
VALWRLGLYKPLKLTLHPAQTINQQTSYSNSQLSINRLVMSPTPLTVIIVGNGVAGPILAMALQKISKHKVILVDAGPEEAQPIGAAIAIAPNGLNALKFIEADYIVTEKGSKMEQMTIGQGPTNTRLVNETIAEQFTQKYGFAVSDLVCFELL